MLDRTSLSWSVFLALSGASFIIPAESQAAAFQLKEKSAKAQGRSFAGSISTRGDASVIADNPAAMRLLDGRLLQVDLTAVDYSIKFDGAGGDALRRPLSGGNGGDAGKLGAVPAAYFYTPVGDRMHLGLSLTAPFGFSTEYDRNWIGRYHGVHTELQAIDLGASFSYDVNPYVSFGASVFIERAEAKIENAIDFGAMLAGSGVPGFAPTSADGYTKLDGSNNEWGFTIGGLFSPTDHTHIGIAYRSEVKHKIDDVDMQFDVPTNVAPVLAVARPGWFTDTRAATELRLPATLTASISHNVNDRWTIMADVTRTAWGKFKDVRLDFESDQPDQVLEFGYRDSTFFSLGTEYRLNHQWTLRAGVAYDESPVTSEVRDVRVPDVRRKWLSVGATWQPVRMWEYSLGYTHLFLDDPGISLTSGTSSTLSGTYEYGTDILAMAAVYRF
ncbi:TPA: outer membrane protein transport protein [Pseudomonas aeruginosa]|uniref:outer membrane protein transport protein n=1 Tax=Pseudomonas aeruginosa TaxID=287 RepID=UPI0018C4B675|nr:outer membrane protein transport protein [Pseudomonas aeruginosa]MBG4410342.1 outer membrane protein transport protein [Pseudomonas aeruginosa]